MDYTEPLIARMRACRLCPRQCGANRLQGETGFCRSDAALHIAAITLHRGEEPVLGGERGICNVFFSRCNLGCLYCQNSQISRASSEIACKFTEIDAAVEHIAAILESGVTHVGFVSPSHMTAQMATIVEALWARGARPVVVYNSGGYDSVDTLRRLEGLVDVYLPDCKYMDAGLAGAWSNAPDYPEVAAAALGEMYRQMGHVLHLDDEGLALRGLIVRHLVLPEQRANSLAVLRFLARELSPRLTLSLMAQYRPTAAVAGHPQLGRRLAAGEYAEVLREMEALGFASGFVQEPESADCYNPDFSREDPFGEADGQGGRAVERSPERD